MVRGEDVLRMVLLILAWCRLNKKINSLVKYFPAFVYEKVFLRVRWCDGCVFYAKLVWFTWESKEYWLRFSRDLLLLVLFRENLDDIDLCCYSYVILMTRLHQHYCKSMGWILMLITRQQTVRHQKVFLGTSVKK